ncbi:MAG: HNH endonuclease [Candidatus Methylumidiphilus sp.]
MPKLFCHISWMREYKGHHRIDGQIDQPKRGGFKDVKHGTAHECCNFLPDENGMVYGHVETSKDGKNGKKGYDAQIKIENLGTNKNDPHIDGIDVIWTATHDTGGKRVVGWYKNARVYRERQTHEEYPTVQYETDNVYSYRITAKQEDVTLIAENNRIIFNPNRVKSGWPGMNSIFYPSNYVHNAELNRFLEELDVTMQEEEGKPPSSPDNPFEGSWGDEGREQLKIHKRKERSAKLIKDFKAQLTDFSCSICGFSFIEAYGELGHGFIEAHHIIPISKLKEQTKMSTNNLIAVCSNCHRMLHRKNPLLTAKELKKELR